MTKDSAPLYSEIVLRLNKRQIPPSKLFLTVNSKTVFFPFILLLLLLLPSVTSFSFSESSKTDRAHSDDLTLQESKQIADPSVDVDSQDLASRATHVVIGEVQSSDSRWDKTERVIYAYVRISVEDFLKGNFVSNKIVVKYKGGEVGGIGLLDSAEPRFWKGERVKVFLKLQEETDEFVVVAGRQGKISLSSAVSAGYSYDWIHWDASDLPAKYYTNENGTFDLPGTAEEFAAVQASFQTWEDDAGSYMDYTYMGTTTRNGSARDGFNVVSWQSIDGLSGTLAETSFWYDSDTKLLFEFDIVFDEDETWSASGETGKYDIQNVGTHEVGHTLGLNDLYDSADSEQTMYGYSNSGEIKKRDLYTGDIAGIRFIYGLSTITYTVDTNPTGLQIEVDGRNYTTPYSFSWFSGSDHFVNAFSPKNGDVGTRYVFEKWSDGNAQFHSVRVGTSDVSLIADYTRQYQISIRFETDDEAQEIFPTRVQLVGGFPNITLIMLRSYSNFWLDDVQWTIQEILWQKNNIVPLNYPTARLSANLEWTVNCRVYPTWFNESFRNSKGSSLPNNPSSFQLEFPNGTTSDPLNSSQLYYLQNGTTNWHSITWQNTEVVPSNAAFDAADGNPTVNCRIYDFLIKVTDILDLPVWGASVSVTLPNGTTVEASTKADGSTIFKMIPQGRFTARVLYVGQATTINSDVALAAARVPEAKITPSLLPIMLITFVPMVAACLLILIVARRRTRVQQASPGV